MACSLTIGEICWIYRNYRLLTECQVWNGL